MLVGTLAWVVALCVVTVAKTVVGEVLTVSGVAVFVVGVPVGASATGVGDGLISDPAKAVAAHTATENIRLKNDKTKTRQPRLPATRRCRQNMSVRLLRNSRNDNPKSSSASTNSATASTGATTINRSSVVKPQFLPLRTCGDYNTARLCDEIKVKWGKMR